MMLCKSGNEVDVLKHDKKWVAQRKIDGCRCLAICFDGNVSLKGRGGTDYTKKFPEIVEDLKGLNGSFDAEVVCDTFEHTASRVHTENSLKLKLLAQEYPAKLIVFDIIEDKPYIERLEMLKRIQFKGSIELIETTTDLIGLWNKAKNLGWEGIVIKNPLSKYEAKRSPNWLKIKNVKSKDIVFTNYEVNNAGIKITNGDTTIQVSGSNSISVRNELDKRGEVLVEVEYLNETDSSKLRMPVFKCLKDY